MVLNASVPFEVSGPIVGGGELGPVQARAARRGCATLALTLRMHRHEEMSLSRTVTLRLRRTLLGWYRREGRDLPWRRTRDPYAIWVSEVMLQQTTVETVIPYYDRFLARYPDLPSLARSREDDLLALWSGLGYYRRARNLRAAAMKIAEERDGNFPSDREEILALPGVGRYTAGAIASICFGAKAAVVDTNVARVLSRLFALQGPPAAGTSASLESTLWRIAEELVPGREPGNWNQALMELGARICRPANPLCPGCPAAFACRALAEGDPARYTASKKRAPSVGVRASLFVVSRNGRILLVRRPKSELLGGLWELPGTLAIALGRTAGPRGGETRAPAMGRTDLPVRAGGTSYRVSERGESWSGATHEELEQTLGFIPVRLEPAGCVRHAVTHRRLALDVWRAEAPGRLPPALRPESSVSHLWLEPHRIHTIPIGSSSLKALAQAYSPQPTEVAARKE